MQPITKANFANKSWKRHSDFSFTAKDTACPLGAAELPRAMMCMPLAFISNSGEYTVAAIQGLLQDTNFYVGADGVWQGSYIPAAYRGYPFVLANDKAKKNGLVLCIDTDSGLLIDDNTGEPFFGEGLEPSQAVTKIIEFLSNLIAAQKASIQICKSLSDHGLLKPWALEIGKENETKQVQGLFCIDENALKELSDDCYSEIRRAGAIPVIYCQLLSMQRIFDLTQFAGNKSEFDWLLEPNELDFDGVNKDGGISFENL